MFLPRVVPSNCSLRLKIIMIILVIIIILVPTCVPCFNIFCWSNFGCEF